MAINPAQFGGPTPAQARVLVDDRMIEARTIRVADAATLQNRDSLTLDNPRAELFRQDVMMYAVDPAFGINTASTASAVGSGGNIYDILWALLSKFQDGLTQQVKDLEGKYFDASGKLKEGVSEVEV